MPTDTDTQKLLQYLNEAHATEAGLVQTLTAHIAMTPAGDYRDLLERHLKETDAQTQRLEQRLKELGVTKNPLQMVVGIAETVISQVLPTAKLPLDLLRGTSGEEKLLKNAKDEAASEALEIATYDAIEALANHVGDEKTATLAREHRTQEEVFLKDLRAQIPALVTGVVDEMHGKPTYDPTTTGAADVAKKAAGRFQRKAEAAKDKVQDVAGDAQEAAEDVKDEVRDQAKATLDDVKPVSDPDAPPIEGYDKLTADQVLPKLEDLDADQLAAIDGLERATKDRKKVLNRIAALRQKRTDEALARIG